MTKFKIGGRVFLVSFFLMLVGIVVTSTVNSLVFIEEMRKETDATLFATTYALDIELNAIFERMKMRLFSQLLIDTEEMIWLIERNNFQELDKRMKVYLQVSEFSTLTLTDAKGVVINRPHAPNRIGDDISAKGYVWPALKGQEVQVIENGTTIGLGLFYGMPIIKDGAVVGTITAGVDLEDPTIINYLSKTHHAELTFYYGDKRVNTTLQQHEQRLIEPKAPPEVVEAVLERGESYYKELKLGNKTLRTLYKPFVFAGKRVGMLAAGLSTNLLDRTIQRAVHHVSISSALFILLAMGVSYMFAKNIAKLSSEKTQQELFLSLLMKNTPDTILILDTDENLIDCSDVFLHRPHVNGAKQIKNRTFPNILNDFLNVGEVEHLRKVFAEAIENKKSISLDKVINFHFHREDNPRSYTVRFSPMLDVNDDILGCLVMFHDLTDLQMAQHAEAALQAKSVFLANISHEIRTPLNAVIGLSEIELRNTLPQETHDNLEKIYRSSGTLLHIINDILDISKIDSGNFELVPADYEFSNMISDTIHLNVVRLASKPVTFEPHVDENIPRRLHGDELRVKQILNNILSNAFKYTQEGKVTLEVSCEQNGKDIYLSFIVSDTGIGIKKEDLGKLFLEYNQLNTQANRKIEGTGLGLSICKNLVGLMKGTIDVESEYGKGSRFMVKILQEIADPTPIGLETAQNLKTFRMIRNREVKKLIRTPMPYGKVLVVDDVVTNLDVAKGLMAPYGLTVHCASSGKQAIELVQEGKHLYDVIFMDHMMPEIDGIEAVHIIRNEIGTEYAKTVPIIALTANAISGNEAMFLANGFQAYLSKPIDVVLLDALLNQWVRDESYEAPPQEAEVTEAAVGVLFHVEGLDTEAGCSRFGGESAYKEVVRSYATHTLRLLDKLREVTEATLPEYAVEVHGLKGSSYGICANAIGKMAEELESAAKKGDIDEVNAKNGALIQAVETLLSRLSSIELDLELNLEKKQSETLHETGPIEKKSVPDVFLLKELRAHCTHYDVTGMETVLSKLERYTYESQNDLIKWLRQQVDDLEYERIVERLEHIG